MSTTRSFKRPFQPSIDSDFGLPTGGQTSLPSSALPATLQSSLLNVGMRVRKSVSEGYQREVLCGLPTSEHDSVTQSCGFTGLVPYCGILKIGSHITQPAPSKEDVPALQFDSDECGFQSSQESSASSDSQQHMVTVPVVSSHKRRREDEDDEFDVESQSVSPRSYPPFSHTRMPNLDRLRPIALPKTRKKPVLEPFELEESEMIDAGEFEEVEFFRPGEWGKDYDHADEA